MKRLITLIAVLVIAIAAFSNVAAQDQNIVEVAASDEQFSILVDLVTAAGLGEALSGEGPFTVFAPTNDAFQALPTFVRDYVIANPDVLTQILLYHVVEGAAVASTDLAPEQMVDSMDMGNELTIVANDMGVMVDDATVIAPDVAASNGIIHVVDTVLLPPITLDVIPADVTGDIVMAGSSTVGPLTIAVADEFTAEGYTGEISVAITGSGAGFERFCESGETDLSNASRAIKQEEIDNCLAIDRNPLEFRVGTDAIAVVVNPANDFATDLTLEELAVAFSAAETWADVREGFPDEPILRFSPGTDSGTYDYFVEEVFEEDEGPIQSASNIEFSEDDNILVQGVANNDFAIGFFGFAFFAENQDTLNILSLDGVSATPENVDSGDYALARPLFVYGDYDIILEKPQAGQFMAYYLENVNRLLISEVTAENAIVFDRDGNPIEYNVSVAYFEANPFALNRSKWVVAAANGMAMGDM